MKKYTKEKWTSHLGFIYALNEERENRFYASVQRGRIERTPEKIIWTEQEELNANADLMADAPMMIETIQQVLNDLPSNKDWLDPQLEQVMKDLVKKHT